MTDVAIIGTGAEPDDPDRTGFAMADSHADGYEAVEAAKIHSLEALVAGEDA